MCVEKWSIGFTRLSKGRQRHKKFYIFHSVQYDTTIVIHTNKWHTLCYNYSNILTYTSSCIFQASMAYHQRVHSCTKQSVHLIIISNLRDCGKFINVWCTVTDMCTVTGAVQWTHSSTQAAPIIVHISVSISQTPKKLIQFHILEMMIKSNDCFLELCIPCWWASEVRNM